MQNGTKTLTGTSSIFSKTNSKSFTKTVLEILVGVESGSMARLPQVVVEADILSHYIDLAVQQKLTRLDEDAVGKAEWAK